MSEIDWVNTNTKRLYPFDGTGAVLIGGVELPRELLADAGFVLGIRAEALAGTLVWLHQVVRVGSDWLLTFYSDGGAYQFEFTIPAGTLEGDTIFTDATPVGGGAADPEYGTAFIVVGDLAAAEAQMVAGTYTQGTPANSVIFASLVQSLHLHYVRRIHLANDPGPTFLPCGSAPVPAPVDATCPPATVMARNFQGDVQFRFGYNARVGVVTTDNRLVLGSGIRAGEGVPCVEVSRDPSGALPVAPTCEGLVYMINGVSPNDDGEFTIQAGKGLQLSVESGRLVVTPDSNAYCTGILGD